MDSLVSSAERGLSAADVSVENILRSNSCRNGLKFLFSPLSVCDNYIYDSVSMILRPTYIYALPQSAPVLSSAALNVLSPSKDSPRIVNASITVRVPEQPLR